jgi:MORN repeat variant
MPIDNKNANANDTIAIKKVVFNDTILKKYYPNLRLSYCIIKEDTNDSKELHIDFYANGKVKEKGYQDLVSNKDVQTKSSIGTWQAYDSTGVLLKETKYNNAVFDSASIEVKRYFQNGKVKVIELYNNYILYETEMKKIGVWQYYNEKGDLVKKEKKNNV